MGMSATQARYLMLTARKSDLELQAQFINQRIIQLSQQTVRFTEDYTAAISNKKIMVADNRADQTQWTDFAHNPQLLLDQGYQIKWGNTVLTANDLDDNGIISGQNDAGENTYFSTAQVQQLFQSGAWEVYDADNEPVHYGSDYGSVVREVLDESDDAQAQATYETKVAKVQAQEKTLELQLKNIETEHKACDTEIDTVKKVLQKNIERSFKTFAG